jgi:N-acetyl sugar amidotransferase
MMRWCTRCVLPDTRPNLSFDDEGVCDACRHHEQRADVDWPQRQETFAALVARAKNASRRYDCLIPVSGGKDSTWQVVTCLQYGLHPLAVTWKPYGRTAIGRANLDNLISLGVDHIDFQVNPRIDAAFTLAALERFGNPAIPMHLALFHIPLSIAVGLQIPMVIYGENAAVEYGGDVASTGYRLDADWIARFGVTHGTTADDWVSATLPREALAPYRGPTAAELQGAAIEAIFLGYFFAWDPRTTLAVARAHGFRSRPEGPKTGLYDYADIDDDFISVHHYIKWYKYGFTRLFDNLSLEIRNGRLSRDQAIDCITQRGDDTPHDDIEAFCRFTGISVGRFYEILEPFRNLAIWKRVDGVWRIPEFLISDWEWQ